MGKDDAHRAAADDLTQRAYEDAFITKEDADGNQVGYVVRRQTEGGRSADVGSSGSQVRTELGGHAPQGESGAIRAARNFIAYLNLRAGDQRWLAPQMPEGPESGIDAESHRVDYASSGECRRMQVTRAASPQTWRRLAKTGRASSEEDARIAAVRLWQAIDAKAKHYAYAAVKDVDLLIDATDSPAPALSKVREAFSQGHAAAVRRLGFRSIWVVGPTMDAVYRLD